MNSGNQIQISELKEILQDDSLPLKKRFRALFALKHAGGGEAIDAIANVFNDKSALLKHELAYCLGQMRDKRAIPVLKKVLSNNDQEPMVRHEAGEALGAIGSEKVLETLETFLNDPSPEVAETCQLAIERIKWLSSQDATLIDWEKSPYATIDPAPGYSEAETVSELKEILCNPQNRLWDRYRAMFKLRNIKSEDAILALADGLNCEDSALFRHEIAFVLGQLKSALAVRHLIDRLQLKEENCMVRHECAEALGAIGTETCRKVLTDYLSDPERVVRESCEVALDIIDYDDGDEFQYAHVGDKISGGGSISADQNGSGSISADQDGSNYYSTAGF